MKSRELLKRKMLILDPVIFESVSNFKLNLNEFLLLAFFLNNDYSEFDLKKVSLYLKMDEKDVLVSFNSLIKKNAITLETKKDGNGKMSEYVSADVFYDSVELNVNSGNNDEKKNIFSIFENEFSRTLSSMEYEIINNWIDEKKYSEELIIGALKESVFSGASNLRYIDKILYEWNKNGFKSMKEVSGHLLKKSHNKEEKKELYDYDWLSDENN